MTQTIWSRSILHLDMDAFYVNVHILDHPADAGVPLVVGGKPDSRGVVSSASYEARKLGIRSAMPTSRALRLCPQLRIVPTNWSQIRECSHQVMTILHTYGPVEQISVDEAYIDLSERAEPENLAAEIQTAVFTQTHLPCSVGLSTSKLVAKVASDHEKPRGCTIVPPGTEAAFLAPLSTRVIWGIGPHTAERLAEISITNCGQLAKADSHQLRAIFGKHGPAMVQRAKGIDKRSVHAERSPSKSISQEWTFNRDVADESVLAQQLQKMCASIATSLQKKELTAHTVYVKFRWPDFTTFTRQRSVTVGIDNEEEILRLAHVIWQDNWQAGQALRLLGVGVSNLETAVVRQLSFDFV